jgi:hypothetical protein
MQTERAHELDDEGTHGHRAMRGFANGGEGGDDGVFGGASATTENRAVIEQLFGEGAVGEVADGFVERVDFFGVDAELVEDAGATLDAADQRMDAGVDAAKEGLGFAEGGAGVFV